MQNITRLKDQSQAGKKRNWRKKKQQSLAVADAYNFFTELEKYANQVAECGSWLKFEACPHNHHKKLLRASFCGCRNCVMCQWRKSLLIKHQVLELAHAHLKKFKSDVPLLLTLTIPNVSGEDLSKAVSGMSYAFHKMFQRARVKKAVRSWFRSLEVTYNKQKNTFHPHYHCLLMVPKNYFDKRVGLYISRNEWLKLWRESTGIKNITQVDIRRVKRKGKATLPGVCGEVAKYATKPGSYIKKNNKGKYRASEKAVYGFHYGLKGKRLIGFGGLFKELRAQLKQEDIETADLVHVTSDGVCVCPVCRSDLIAEMYTWNFGIGDYVKTDRKTDKKIE